MFSSQTYEEDIILAIYKDSRTVFRLKDIAMIMGDDNFESINKKLNYYVKKGTLGNPRKGLYTKENYNTEEMACRIYIPSYISLEYVLQKSGIIFQYDSALTSVSYLSRQIEIEGNNYRFRKIRGLALVNTAGIKRLPNHINIATPERAFLDMLYLDPQFYFDNINSLDKQRVMELLPIYDNKKLEERTKSLIDYA
jgi:hypothetical protein